MEGGVEVDWARLQVSLVIAVTGLLVSFKEAQYVSLLSLQAGCT